METYTVLVYDVSDDFWTALFFFALGTVFAVVGWLGVKYPAKATSKNQPRFTVPAFVPVVVGLLVVFVITPMILVKTWKNVAKLENGETIIMEGLITKFERGGRGYPTSICVWAKCFKFSERFPRGNMHIQLGTKARATHLEKELLRLEIISPSSPVDH
jgi:hypothetical protein